MNNFRINKDSIVSFRTIVALFVVSFWSSGVFFVKVCNTYKVWNSEVLTSIMFLIAIPFVIATIRSMKRFLNRIHNDSDAIMYYIVVGVVLCHAVVLTVYPALYGFVSSAGLVATSWFLWFSGLCMILCAPENSRLY